MATANRINVRIRVTSYKPENPVKFTWEGVEYTPDSSFDNAVLIFVYGRKELADLMYAIDEQVDHSIIFFAGKYTTDVFLEIYNEWQE